MPGTNDGKPPPHQDILDLRDLGLTLLAYLAALILFAVIGAVVGSRNITGFGAIFATIALVTRFYQIFARTWRTGKQERDERISARTSGQR